MQQTTRVLILVLLLVGATGRAVATGASPSGVAYPSEMAAVIAATAAVNARSVREDREFLGAVLRRGADFHFSRVTGQAGADRIRARLAIPAGFELVALWHTHGGPAPERRFFSAVDAALVAGTGKPLYLADHTGALRVLKPGAPTLTGRGARRLGLPARAGFAAGEQVRHQDGEPVHIPTGQEPALALAVSK